MVVQLLITAEKDAVPIRGCHINDEERPVAAAQQRISVKCPRSAAADHLARMGQ